MHEHKIVVVTSRDAEDLPSIAASQLDACASHGWQLVTAYTVASHFSSMSHHFVMQRPKQPAPKE